MFKKKVAILTLVSVISSFSANTTAVLAHELTKNEEKISTQENSADNNEESKTAQNLETSQEEEKSQEQEKSQTEESKETSQDSQEESTESTESTITKKTITLTQNGDTKAKARENLRMVSFGTDLQSTGIVAKPGEKITIYVEADDNAPLPRVAFTQHEAHYANWIREYQLQKGKNVLTVPEIYSTSWENKTVKGGALYLINRYTKEQQGAAPVVTIEGGEAFPTYKEGDDKAQFIKELKAYNQKLKEDPDNTVDIFEFTSNRILYTGTTSAAYQVYVKEGVDILESVNNLNGQIQDAFDFSGLKDDPSDITNDSTNVRTPIRLMQPYGLAYAYGDHVGIQRDYEQSMLRTDLSSLGSVIWTTVHEAGHQMDISAREWPEVTNNMWANNAHIKNGFQDRVNYTYLYKYLAPEKSLRGFDTFDYFQQLGMFWQLQLKKDTYWAELETLYRERKPSPRDYQHKKDILATYSSEVLGINLTYYFEKYGFTLSDECKQNLKKYPDSNEKLWYLNSTVIGYTGSGYTNTDTGLELSISKVKSGVKLSMAINNSKKDDLLGYEILKDGKVIGFTSSNTYIDENATDDNAQYAVIPYAKDLTSANKVEINSKMPSISIQQEKITLKVGEKFDAKAYVKGLTYTGEDITSNIKIENNVNPNKKGNYTVNYELTNEGQTTIRNIEVEVVSDYDYLSDLSWETIKTAWGIPRTNTNIQGMVHEQVTKFKKGIGIHANGKITYDLSDKDYDKFEALIGVDTAVGENNNSRVTFKIVGDGKTLATTNVMHYGDNLAYINVPVAGVKELVIEVYDGGNGNTCDHCIIVNPKLTTNNGKPRITAQEKFLKLGDTLDPRKDVKAHDQEDGDLTSQIQIISNNFVENKVGRYEVVYEVTDSNNNVTRTTGYVTVSEDYKTKRSRYGKFSNLQAYNDAFKLPVVSIKNNAGHYGSSKIQNALDGNINTHWETNTPNSSTFKNEVIFDLGEVQEISRMAYGARRDAYNKGFASKFEIYVSTSESGDDFYLAGSGSYTTGSTNDFVEFKMSNVSARRVKFKFVEAREGWASLCEVAFYKEDKLSDKIESLFTDETKTDVAESYNTLEKLDALRKEVKDHPAYDIFKVELDNAEKIIKAKYPTINVEKLTAVDKDAEFDLMADVEATDQKDGKITSSVVVEDGGFSSSKIG